MSRIVHPRYFCTHSQEFTHDILGWLHDVAERCRRTGRPLTVDSHKRLPATTKERTVGPGTDEMASSAVNVVRTRGGLGGDRARQAGHRIKPLRPAVAVFGPAATVTQGHLDPADPLEMGQVALRCCPAQTRALRHVFARKVGLCGSQRFNYHS